MVHCPNCWTKNEEDAKYCVKCGAALEGSRSARALDSVDEWGEDIGKRAERWGEQFGKRVEEECFGLPHGGAIVGLIIGIIIMIVGLSMVPGLIPPEVREVTDPLFWPGIIIFFGILIIAGVLYRYSRR